MIDLRDAPSVDELTRDDIAAMLRDVRADLVIRRIEMAELEESEAWLAEQLLESAQRKRVPIERFRDWAQRQPGRFTVGDAAKHFDCSETQARKRLRELAARETLLRIIPDHGPEEFEFVKPAPTNAPRPANGNRNPDGTYAMPVPGTGGGSSKGRYTTNKSYNDAIAAAVARGWRVEERGDNTLLLVGPDGERIYTHRTPGEGRAVGNIRGLIRRAEKGRAGVAAR